MYANAAAVRMLGAKDQEELLGRDSLAFVHPDFLEIVKLRTAQIQNRRLDPHLRRPAVEDQVDARSQ